MNVFNVAEKRLVVGISGSTCSGKTTLVSLLLSLFPNSKVFNQDQYYFLEDDPRHTWCKSLNHINWELVSAFDNEKLASDIEQELKASPSELDKERIEKVSSNFKKFYVEGSQILTTKNELTESALKLFEEVEQMSLILVEGITVLNAEPTSKLCQLKFFATLDHETCLKRRTLRSYDPPDVPGYFEQVVWPAYLDLWSDVQSRHKNQFVELDGRKAMQENFFQIVTSLLEHFAN